MKNLHIAILAMVIILLCSSSGIFFKLPDLKVESVTWDGASNTATTVIKNIGSKDAGEFLVYFNADENPVSSNYRPQISQKAAGLAKNASVTMTASFCPLARPENFKLQHVFQITVIADPKNMVKELKENNNSKFVAATINCP